MKIANVRCILSKLLKCYPNGGHALFRAIESYIVRRHFNKIYDEGMIVLDAGCGDGVFAHITLDDFNISIIGVDLYLNEIQKAKRLDFYTHLILADLRSLPFRPNIFDAIICNSVLEHIPNYALALENMKSVLKNSSFLFITTIAHNFEESFILPRILVTRTSRSNYLERTRRIYAHFHEFSVKEILEFLAPHFQIVKCWRIVPPLLVGAYDLLNKICFIFRSQKLCVHLTKLFSLLITMLPLPLISEHGADIFVICKKGRD